MVNRRIWLHGLAGGVIALAGLPSEHRVDPGTGRLEDWLRHTGSALGDPAMLGRLGAAYLTLHPKERDLNTLLRLLSRESSVPAALDLIQHISRDWEGHHIEVLEGWVLARSEARLCAALHLMDGSRA